MRSPPDDRQVGQALADQLKALRDRFPRSAMSPELSYGRHRGPHRARSRQAAVLIAMYRDAENRWMIPLTQRPSSLKHHGGQISLPGGQIEPNETSLQAALREFQEELGQQPQGVKHCGQLPRVYVYASDNQVQPIVALIDRPDQPWHPDPAEVSQVIEFPVSELTNPSLRWRRTNQKEVRKADRVVGQFKFHAPAMVYQEHHVWGATAVILDQFAAVLREIGVS